MLILAIIGLISGWFIGGFIGKRYPDMVGLIKFSFVLIGGLAGLGIGGIIWTVWAVISAKREQEKYKI